MSVSYEEVEAVVRGVPYIAPWNSRFLYDLILEHRLTNVLELGVAHGTSTCYMAAAASQTDGFVTGIDLAGEEWKPSAEEQLNACGLWRYAAVERTRTGYGWWLHDCIEASTHDGVCEPVFDLVFLDGSKQWTVDGCAFFLADKLLKPGGFFVFDDYGWTFGQANRQRDSTFGLRHDSLSDRELRLSHTVEIFNLLVRQHPDYTDFQTWPEHMWACARKSV